MLSQNWTSSVAFVLVNAFRLAICFSIGVAFSQHLWRIIRITPMTIINFDRSHYMRSDIKVLLDIDILTAMPALTIMMAVSWLTTLVIIFPPGALTVVSKRFDTTSSQQVPSFNGGFVGIGTWLDANRYMLGYQTSWSYRFTKLPILSISKWALISGEILSSPSVCGINCTHTIIFDGPLVNCSATSFQETVYLNLSHSEVHRKELYSGGWDSLPDDEHSDPYYEPGRAASGWWRPKDMKTSCFYFSGLLMCYPLEVPTNFSLTYYPPSNSGLTMVDYEAKYNSKYGRTVRTITCRPGLARYTLETEFVNGQQKLDIDVNYIESLESIWAPHEIKNFAPSGANASNIIPNGHVNAFKTMNLFALIDSLVRPISGTYYSSNIERYNTSRWYNDNELHSIHLPTVMGYGNSLYINNTIIADTVFNMARQELFRNQTSIYNIDADEFFKLDLTEDKINSALQNITISVMYSLGWWNETTNVTTTNYQTLSPSLPAHASSSPTHPFS
ncbi:hypothetical protein B0J11DRAFT_235182 [Dendryphion nanum]|uniref:Uncharacterized protein n=1 Tax=Dendryphion nanum TaxID=256645 RepID=A0A9P9CYV9_9PLEO|nr:hypothetical protein B0J11DRAFT_235182 [Dendryphion nanum]